MPELSHIDKKIDDMQANFNSLRSELTVEMKDLTQNINRLTQLFAVQTERDHHFQSSHDDLKGRVDDHAHRITALEKISAGDEAIRRVFNGGITVIVGLVIVGALYAWATK